MRIPLHVLSIHDLEEGEDCALSEAVEYRGLGIGSRSSVQTIRDRNRAGLRNNRNNLWDIEHFSRTDEIRVRADQLRRVNLPVARCR